MSKWLYEVCILLGDDVLQSSQTDSVPFVPRKNDIIMDNFVKFKVTEIRVKYLEQGIRLSVYVKKIENKESKESKPLKHIKNLKNKIHPV